MTKHIHASSSNLVSWLIRLSLPAVIASPLLVVPALACLLLPLVAVAVLVAIENGLAS